jgi:hypothetical protein
LHEAKGDSIRFLQPCNSACERLMRGQQAMSQKRKVEITGVYSKLFVHPETLDALVRELIVSRISSDRYSIVLQCAEGEMNEPLLARATFSKG